MSRLALECTTNGCEERAARIIAWLALEGKATFVAPYCSEHAADIEVDMGGLPASGPALSDEARKIEGIR